ncbi:fluoride efflux transporter CrcB [Candidatus Venteria ishoeyi]|uniref:Fluoride-specific ion channel FluC n=1 Tax=Candidatus Venteria ishoeyi TaxID=1899563 RepID=A0A1H6FEU1_9GAMM|nr:fluoride efflux transporter CrcB [Candidatus Venteria ishoeyi]SEH08537.1 Putative fluoride ion transporter CrcB [Candidatus Venteria ishoeyi]
MSNIIFPQLLVIACGGALGAITRFWVSTSIYHWLGRGFPYGTLAVNIIGSFLMGFLAVYLVERLGPEFSPQWRAAILIGFLGSFTTFSTFSLETLHLLLDDDYLRAFLNILLSLVTCIGAAGVGFWFARQL